MSSEVLAFLAMLGAGAVGAGASFLVKSRLSFSVAPGHNEFTGIVFAAVAALYAVLLAFVVVAVWEQYSDTEHATASEAASMITAYRDTQDLTEPQRSRVRTAYREYASAVITTEWADHGASSEDAGTADLLNPVHEEYAALDPVGDLAIARLIAAEAHLYDLEVSRHERHLALEHRLPSMFWLVLPAGGVITVAFLFFYDFGSRRVHATFTGMLAAALVAVLALIVTLDSPYAGVTQVSKEPFEDAILQMDAMDWPAS